MPSMSRTWVDAVGLAAGQAAFRAVFPRRRDARILSYENMARSPASRFTMTSGTGPDRAKRPPYRYGLITVLLNEPPWQPALAKPARATETPHTFTGTLTGAFTLLPDRAEMAPALPLSLPPAAPLPMTVLLAAPPSQPAFAPPSRATATPQTSIGALTGAFTSLPDRSDSTPALPLSLGPSANAALAGSTKPAVSTAVPIAAEIQRAFFIVLLLFRPAVACATGDADVRRDVSVPGPTAEPLPSVPGAHSRTPSVRRV